jgi:hypothetical protein
MQTYTVRVLCDDDQNFTFTLEAHCSIDAIATAKRIVERDHYVVQRGCAFMSTAGGTRTGPNVTFN